MDPVRNPYTPGAGSQPPVLVGREAQLDGFRVLLDRLKLARPEKSLIVTGLRGVGKTVLLNTFEGIAEKADFRTAKAEITHDAPFGPSLVRLARRALLSISPMERWRDRASRAAAVLKSFTLKLPDGPEIGFDIDPAVGVADSGDFAEDLGDLLIALGEAAQDHETGVAFLLDEIQLLKRPELEALITALHRTSQRALPITLVGAGLPQLPALTGEARSYSERLFDFPRIGRLSDEHAREALEKPAEREDVAFETSALREVIEYTEGYPYFLQEFGKHVWNIAEGEDEITLDDVINARPRVQLQLDDNFFSVRTARCTDAELKYIAAMADLGEGPYRSGHIAAKLDRGAEAVAPTRARLINKGLIYSPSHGQNEFTVPQFADYLRRTHPLSDFTD